MDSKSVYVLYGFKAPYRCFNGSIKNWKKANLTVLIASSDISFVLYALLAMSQIDFFKRFTRVFGKSGKSSDARILLVPVRLRVTLVCGI